jgi:hypothetical protein
LTNPLQIELVGVLVDTEKVGFQGMGQELFVVKAIGLLVANTLPSASYAVATI